MGEQINTITQSSSLPTPIIPPILVRRVTGLICQSDIVLSTTLSKTIDIPNKSFDSTIPVFSTLYLHMKLQYFALYLLNVCIPCSQARYQTIACQCKSLQNIIYRNLIKSSNLHLHHLHLDSSISTSAPSSYLFPFKLPALLGKVLFEKKKKV